MRRIFLATAALALMGAAPVNVPAQFEIMGMRFGVPIETYTHRTPPCVPEVSVLNNIFCSIKPHRFAGYVATSHVFTQDNSSVSQGINIRISSKNNPNVDFKRLFVDVYSALNAKYGVAPYNAEEAYKQSYDVTWNSPYQGIFWKFKDGEMKLYRYNPGMADIQELVISFSQPTWKIPPPVDAKKVDF